MSLREFEAWGAPKGPAKWVAACFYGSVGGQEMPKRRVKMPAAMRVKVAVTTAVAGEQAPPRRGHLYYDLAGYHLGEAIYVRRKP